MDTPQSQKSSVSAIFLRVLFSLALLILLWKFGSPCGGEIPTFPISLPEWLFCGGFSTTLAALIGLTCLILAILCRPAPAWNNPSSLAPLLWGCFLLTSLPGCLHTTEWEFTLLWLMHQTGCLAMLLAIWWCAGTDENCLPSLAQVLGALGLIAALHGWYQHFIGLEQNLQLTIETLRQQQWEISPILLEKLRQTRIFGSFNDPNLYGSLLIVTFPFSLYSARLWGRKFEYPRAGEILLTALTLLLYFCAIFWSGSRGAAIGFAGGIAAVFYWHPILQKKHWRWLLPSGGILLALLLLSIMCLGTSRQGFASAVTRLQYYRAALLLFLEHPLAGIGLGEFFPLYLQLLPPDGEIARNVHSILLSHLCQCGILGGLSVLALILFGWLAGSKSDKKATKAQWFSLENCGRFAFAAWCIHSLFQFNELVPASLYTAAIASLFLLPPPKNSYTSPSLKPQKSPLQFFLLIPVFLLFLWISCRIPGEISLQSADQARLHGNTQGAISLNTRAAKQLPHSLIPSLALWNQAMDTFNAQEAEKWSQQLLKTAPHRATHYLYAAATALLSGNLKQAEAALNTAEHWHPRSPKLRLWKALLAELQNRKNQSEKASIPITWIPRLLHAEITQKESEKTVFCSWHHPEFQDAPLFQVLQRQLLSNGWILKHP